ncbi:hypothetical protein KP509_02G081200 [Ceratopteris richardii]|uniref:NADH dehydrogenase [ubiquinone] 1 alpha subcomplex subunit 1 n=1 Tax=Ceratopteris richardii TaxID=49495 RepID=A0A8T2VET8_CERRI|nr:hypothetical protein KP509_02G081200 [Ceratopteris richardii]
MAWESAIPMAIVVGMVFLMGESQGFFHKLYYGKPKHPCSDAWDRAMEQRDVRLLKAAAAAAKE